MVQLKEFIMIDIQHMVVLQLELTISSGEKPTSELIYNRLEKLMKEGEIDPEDFVIDSIEEI